MRHLYALLLLPLVCSTVAAGQSSKVTPGERFTIDVNGEPFYPLGWNLVGQCARLPEERFETMRDSLEAEMERIRTHGVNAVFEPSSGDGRYIPYQVDDRWYNWYNYAYTDFDGRERTRGHIRAGVYVAALKSYMNLAYFGADGTAAHPIRTFVSLNHYTIPEGIANPYGGGDTLRCATYRGIIEEEQERHAVAGSEFAGAIPSAVCDEADRLPLWEWNVRYIVQNLRDHPGLLAWYLWDEPEGVTWRHLFGITTPGTPAPPYTGPQSLPTPDLLRHAYQRVIAFEREGRPAAYQRHPIVVDLYGVDAFFSDRFSWSREGDLRPEYHSGPFDRAPDGSFDTPADILGLDASVFSFETASYDDQPAHGWYWDPNLISRGAEMMRDAVERDGLWSSLVISGQSWLAHSGPFGVPEPLRCPINDRPRLSLLNDRDLVWHLMTPQINGLRGELYYARAYNPYEGVGAEQVARTDRMLDQFRNAGFDRIFRAPHVDDDWHVESIDIEALTNYFRSDPDFVGPAEGYDPGRSAFSKRIHLADPDAYRPEFYTRSAAPESYGHPVQRSGVPTNFEAHRLLRTALHRYDGALYLFVSNAYDARISANLWLSDELSHDRSVREGAFNLNVSGRFVWNAQRTRLRSSYSDTDGLRMAIGLEPYEVRLFRIGL